MLSRMSGFLFDFHVGTNQFHKIKHILYLNMFLICVGAARLPRRAAYCFRRRASLYSPRRAARLSLIGSLPIFGAARQPRARKDFGSRWSSTRAPKSSMSWRTPAWRSAWESCCESRSALRACMSTFDGACQGTPSPKLQLLLQLLTVD